MKKELSATTFNQEVMKNERLSLVKFITHWSGACQILKPVYDELTKCYKGAVQFFIVDIEKEKKLPAEFGITEVPSILFFKGGKLIDHAVGLTSKDVLITKIENALSNHTIK